MSGGPTIPGIPGLQAPPPAATEGPPRRRYEFVVMFVWREPGADIKTPADVLAGTPATTGSGSAGGPPPGMKMGPMGGP